RGRAGARGRRPDGGRRRDRARRPEGGRAGAQLPRRLKSTIAAGGVRRMVRPRFRCYSRRMMFPPLDPDRLEKSRRRFRAIPVRMLGPNVLPLLALGAGLTAIRLAIEGKLEWALGAIVFAAALDGIDGRVARMIKGQSRFGAELDSL